MAADTMNTTALAVKIGYTIETNYAGGKAGAAYAQTASTTNSDLATFNYLMEGTKFPKCELDFTDVSSVGAAFDTKTQFLKGYKNAEVVIVQYIQHSPTNGGVGSVWLDAICKTTADGAKCDSYYIHAELAADDAYTYDAFGCVVSNYKLEVKNREWSKETITFKCYSVIPSAKITDMYALPTSQPQTWVNHTTTFTIGAETFPNLKSYTVDITRKFLEDQYVGKISNALPLSLGHDAKFDCEWYGTNTQKLAIMKAPYVTAKDVLTDPVVLFVIVVGVIGAKTLTLTNFMVESNNQMEIPGKPDLWLYKATFKPAGATTYATA